MYRQKSLIRRLIPWLIVAIALACLVIFVFVPIYSQKEDTNTNPPVISYYEGDETPLVMENDDLVFTMDPTTTRFQIVEKASGRTWDSTPADGDKDPIALTANKEALSATMLVGYTTSSGEITMNNNAYSIANQTYQLKQQEDGSIRVDYSVGKIDRIYTLPTAITKDRFNTFVDAMSKKNKKQTTSNYSLYEPEKLDKKENKEEIIAMYPSVQEQPLYILKGDVSAANKQKLESYFAEAGYTQEDFEIDQQLVAGKKETSGPVFNVSVIYRLEGKDLVLEIPYSEIRYRTDYPITAVTPLPMFGAAGTDQDGFLLIPEGASSGSITGKSTRAPITQTCTDGITVYSVRKLSAKPKMLSRYSAPPMTADPLSALSKAPAPTQESMRTFPAGTTAIIRLMQSIRFCMRNSTMFPPKPPSWFMSMKKRFRRIPLSSVTALLTVKTIPTWQKHTVNT